MFWRCIPGHCLIIKLPCGLDADLLDYCWSNLFSESMILLFWYTKSIMTIRTWVFGPWIFFLKVQKWFSYTYQRRTCWEINQRSNFWWQKSSPVFIWWTFSHMHQLTCLDSNISFFSVSKENRSRALFFCAVHLLIYLLLNWHWKLQKKLLICMTCICLQNSTKICTNIT